MPPRRRLDAGISQVDHSKRLALLGGAGYGWMPRHLVEDDLSAGVLVELDTASGSQWTYRPHLAHRRGTPMGRAARLSSEFLLEEIRAEAEGIDPR